MKNYALILAILLSLLIPVQSWGADFRKGEEAYMIGDYATALREWTPLAEKGDLAAQFKLANMYRKGIGVPQDYTEQMCFPAQQKEYTILMKSHNLE